MDKSFSIKGAIVIVIALSLSLWLGASIVTDQTQTILYIAGAGLLLTGIFLGRKIWLFLILFSALNVPLIRGFSTADLGQALFVGFTIIITLLRRQPYKFSFGWPETCMLLLASCVIQVYLRNPVGLNMFGAGAVGARPYFMITLSFVTALFLANIVVRPDEIRWAMILTMVGSIIGVGLSALRMRNGGVAAFDQGNQIDDGQGAGRVGAFMRFSSSLARIIVAFVSPLRGCIHPLWGLLILATIFISAASGFRNSVAMVGLLFIAGIAYRGGGISLAISIFLGTLFFGILAFVNVISPLPPNVQRALSPFPGTWEKRHVDAANDSTEWRVDMWKEALSTDYWIQNKLLGDGLGFTRKELNMMMEMEEGGRSMSTLSSGMTRQQESMMITGNYHSGPVQTIRSVGYVGLFFLILAMTVNAIHAHRQIKRCRGTEWFTVSLYFCIPIIVNPIFFILVFGEFGSAAASTFIAYAMIRLLEKNLPLPAYIIRKRQPYVLMNHRNDAALRES